MKFYEFWNNSDLENKLSTNIKNKLNNQDLTINGLFLYITDKLHSLMYCDLIDENGDIIDGDIDEETEFQLEHILFHNAIELYSAYQLYINNTDYMNGINHTTSNFNPISSNKRVEKDDLQSFNKLDIQTRMYVNNSLSDATFEKMHNEYRQYLKGVIIR